MLSRTTRRSQVPRTVPSVSLRQKYLHGGPDGPSVRTAVTHGAELVFRVLLRTVCTCRVDPFATEGQLRCQRSTENAGRDYTGRTQPSTASCRRCWRFQSFWHRHGKWSVRKRGPTFRRLCMRNLRWARDAHWLLVCLGAAASGPGEGFERGHGLDTGPST
jgi:hypothetical protein